MNGHLLQYFQDAATLLFVPDIDAASTERLCLLRQSSEDALAVVKAAGALHVLDGVPLDLLIQRFLLQDIDELEICWVATDRMYDGE